MSARPQALMILRSIFVISLICLTLQAKGQLLEVVSYPDRVPIEHVAVFNTTRERAALTDSLGRIDLLIFKASDTVSFRHPSFITASYPMKELSGKGSIMLHRRRILIDEYVISASRYRESKMIIPYMVDVLDQQALYESTALTAAGILEGTGNVMVQRTQGGGGSPILRGFESNKILLVVDGVRLNNAIYRNGHLQNSITIDPAILERTEVIFGPTSIIYGSDALGGVIHYYTRDPEIHRDSVSAPFHLQAYSRYASAMKGKTAHLDFSLAGSKWGSLTSITYKDLGEIRMGKRRDPYLGEWGKVLHYVARVDGTDSTLVNPDPLVQKNTGYSQVDLLQKFRFAPSQYVDWILNMQLSTSSDIDRLDQLNDYDGENLTYASHYYGPQKRWFVSLKNVLKKDNALFTNMTTIVAFQKVDEDRMSRRFRNPELLIQQEDVSVYSLNMDLVKMWGANRRLHYGIEFSYNSVLSAAWYEHITTGTRQVTQTRYPEGGSGAWSASAYGSYKWILHQKLVLNMGARYNWSLLSSHFDNPLLPYKQIRISNGALTGSAGLVFTPSEQWQLNTILSTGFRNPNVDDYGKVRAKDALVTVPNPDLAPEYTYNAEIGISRILEGYMKLEGVIFATYLKDAIVRTFYSLNGEDSLYYDGEYYRITANYNAGRAYIYGASLNITANLNPNILLKGTLNYTRGHNITDDVPLGHIPPLFGRTSITYRKNRFYVDAYIIYQGWKHREEFSPYGEDNEGEAMEYGFPSWWTENIRAGFQARGYLDLNLAVENLFDQFYKPYASGISAPGRNVILTARFTLQ